MHYACKDMQAYAFYKQVNEDSLGHMQGICKGHASRCKHMQAYVDICTHMQTHMQSICQIANICIIYVSICSRMHGIC